MQKNTTIISVIISLIVGLAIGYGVGAQNASSLVLNKNTKGGHVMSDGSMMEGSGKMDMTEMMRNMNAELKGKTGDSFDQAFLSEMIIHHQGAVEMAELALTNAKRQEIKDLAQVIITAQKKEIFEMKSWQKSWFNQ